MRPAVLVDTGPLYAAVDPDDQYHVRAQRELQTLVAESHTVLLPYPILLEAYTLVLYRLGKRVAATWVEQITTSTIRINPTVEDYRAALGKISNYEDQAITLFDGVVAVLAERLECPVWTFDFHFDVMRIPVWR